MVLVTPPPPPSKSTPPQYPRESAPPQYTRPPSPSKSTPIHLAPTESTPTESTPTQLYNHLLGHILTKSDLSPDIHPNSVQKSYLSTNRMRLILLAAIRAVDKAGSFSVISKRDQDGKYYVDINLILGGKPVPLEFKSYFAGWEDFSQIVTEKNLGHLVNAIERQISCSQQYALRRLFSSFLGINEDHQQKQT